MDIISQDSGDNPFGMVLITADQLLLNRDDYEFHVICCCPVIIQILMLISVSYQLRECICIWYNLVLQKAIAYVK